MPSIKLEMKHDEIGYLKYLAKRAGVDVQTFIYHATRVQMTKVEDAIAQSIAEQKEKGGASNEGDTGDFSAETQSRGDIDSNALPNEAESSGLPEGEAEESSEVSGEN
jgi:hypothetical protein